MNKITINSLIFFAISFGIAALSIAWYLPFPYVPISGDDIINLDGVRKGLYYSNIGQIFTLAPFEKYRPVFGLIFLSAYKIIGDDFQGYVILNVIIQMANAFLFAASSYLITKSRTLATLAAVLYICARYAYMQLWLVTGLVEGAAMLFFQAGILSSIVALSANKMKLLWASVGFWICCTLTHERYIALVLPMLFGVFSLYRLNFVNKRYCIVLSFFIFLCCIFNILFKKLFLKSGFLVGTGGREVNSDLYQKTYFMLTSIVNSLGLNKGPSYLSGENYTDSPRIIILLGLVGALVILIFLLKIGLSFLITSKSLDERNRLAWLFFLIAFLSLILTASVSFRQEFRWIYAPYVVLVLWVLNSTKSVSILFAKHLLFVILFISSILCDYYYAGRIRENIYFMSWYHRLNTDIGDYPLSVQRIVDFGPREVFVGDGFNVQANGENGVWLKVTGRAKCGHAFVDDTPIESACSDPKSGISNISFGMPKIYTQNPGVHTITFIDSEGKGWLPVIFTVKSREDNRKN